MVSSSLLHAGPHRTAVGVSNGCSEQPGPSPRCCPTGSQSAASRRVPSVISDQHARFVPMHTRQTPPGFPQRLHRRLTACRCLAASFAKHPSCC